MTQLTEQRESSQIEREGLLENEERWEEEKEDKEQENEEETVEDRRFHQPTPSPFKRILLLLFIGFLFWMAFVLGRARILRSKKPEIVYANRYVF